jgi:hypothetical protein
LAKRRHSLAAFCRLDTRCIADRYHMLVDQKAVILPRTSLLAYASPASGPAGRRSQSTPDKHCAHVKANGADFVSQLQASSLPSAELRLARLRPTPPPGLRTGRLLGPTLLLRRLLAFALLLALPAEPAPSRRERNGCSAVRPSS